MTAPAPSIGRHDIADFVRSALAAPPAPDAFDFVAAGIPIRLGVDESALTEAYRARLTTGNGAVPDWRLDIVIADGLPGWADERHHPRDFHAALAREGLVAAYPYRAGIWHVCDLEQRRGRLLLGDTALLPPWDSGAPLRQHLHWILKSSGQRLVHAAAVGENGRGVLFLGNAGAGKSGLTLAGLAVGLQTVGDDYVALSAQPRVVARSLYRIVKQDRFGLGQVPQLAAEADDMPVNWKGKVELDPDRYFPGAFVDELEIGALVLPRIAEVARPQLTRVSPREAMLALMRSNLHQFPGEPEDGMAFFGDVLRRLPVFAMDLSPHFPHNGEAVRNLLQRLETKAHA